MLKQSWFSRPGARSNRQTVNGVLKDFERRGFVSVAFGRIDILDDAALAAVAHGMPGPAPAAAPAAATAPG